VVNVKRHDIEKKIQDINGNPAYSEDEKKVEILKLSKVDEFKEKIKNSITKTVKKVKFSK